MKALWISIALTLACAGCQRESAMSVGTGGNPARGVVAIKEVGCGSCHLIPGIRQANGKVAPPLTSFAERTFIAGRVPNTPDNLVLWISNPPAIDPQTAMPQLGLSDQQARDVAAYLYTLR
jgi:cytochrome c